MSDREEWTGWTLKRMWFPRRIGGRLVWLTKAYVRSRFIETPFEPSLYEVLWEYALPAPSRQKQVAHDWPQTEQASGGDFSGVCDND